MVIAATDSTEAVARLVEALGPGDRFEVIVAAARDRVRPMAAMFGVLWIEAEPGAGVPRLRRLGLDRARGEVVAFTEDSIVPERGWAGAWIAAFADPDLPVATGNVEPDLAASTLDWAVFCCEYAPFLRNCPSGASRVEFLPSAPRLAGNVFAVRAGLIPADGSPIHETSVRHALADRGIGPRVVDGAGVRQVRRYGPREAIHDRLRFGLEFGRLRAGGGWIDLAAPIAGPLILASQAARLVATLAARRRLGGRFVETLPITLALLAAWSVGEWLGWLIGSPDRPRPWCKRRAGAGRPPSRGSGRGPSRPPRYRRGRASA